MSTNEKLIRDGKVAVAYSPGYGAGWSTWEYSGHAAELAMDRTLCEAVDRGDLSAAVVRAREIAGENFYDGGARNLKLMWLPRGTEFEIKEYDGSESVETSSRDWLST